MAAWCHATSKGTFSFLICGWGCCDGNKIADPEGGGFRNWRPLQHHILVKKHGQNRHLDLWLLEERTQELHENTQNHYCAKPWSNIKKAKQHEIIRLNVKDCIRQFRAFLVLSISVLIWPFLFVLIQHSAWFNICSFPIWSCTELHLLLHLSEVSNHCSFWGFRSCRNTSYILPVTFCWAASQVPQYPVANSSCSCLLKFVHYLIELL